MISMPGISCGTCPSAKPHRKHKPARIQCPCNARARFRREFVRGAGGVAYLRRAWDLAGLLAEVGDREESSTDLLGDASRLIVLTHALDQYMRLECPIYMLGASRIVIGEGGRGSHLHVRHSDLIQHLGLACPVEHAPHLTTVCVSSNSRRTYGESQSIHKHSIEKKRDLGECSKTWKGHGTSIDVPEH
eukprot:COSAG05_NODE_10409_length_567_cov_0.717949_1_plen_188_part_11